MSRNNDIDMTSGAIWKHIVRFALPMMVGLLFQQLYNTVDTVVVGQFVGKEALAAVGCNGNIINVLVGTFAGLATGASVVVSQSYGAHDEKRLKDAVHTTMTVTLILCVVGTLLGFLLVKPLLRMNATPDDVLADATDYLNIYFAGLTGLLIYNMGTGILRAVGDSRRPLYFLIVSAVINTALDLLFVAVFGMGVKGVALATIIAEAVSAVLVMVTLLRTDAPYGVRVKQLCLSRPLLRSILSIGMPSAIQSGITSFSNVFVQSYINYFGSACMAGWARYSKTDPFVVIPMQAVAMASTTFVGQNWGAGDKRRARQGVSVSMRISLVFTVCLSSLLIIFAGQVLTLFTQEADVLEFGTYFIRRIIPFYFLLCFNQIYSGALRGIGNSKTPTVIMLLSFVAFRQVYLYITRLLSGSRFFVALAYPIGWILCSTLLIIFYRKSALFREGKPEENTIQGGVTE